MCPDSSSILLVLYAAKLPFGRTSRGSSACRISEVGSSPFGAASNARRKKNLGWCLVQPIAHTSPRTLFRDGSTVARMHNQYGDHRTASCSSQSTNVRPCCMCGGHAACWPWISSTPSEWEDLYPAASTQTEKISDSQKIEVNVVVRGVSSPDARS